ncbi:uncharacterized protein LOC127900563 [Citrus sinensis]|uniref:uncharacterized protein LOC127900563 n=1 Tax=Citrus sinensis TaxID=2711 RepID=UPI002277D5CC|nr:uncharacterized protein LOC127900563 [Citrus sinensis]
MDPHDVDVEDKAYWSSRTEKTFIRIVHDHVKKGQLKSKFNRLRKKHREFFDLIAHTGFGWDPISNTVTVSEAVLAEYIKRVSGVKSYRKKGLEHYQTLGEIFNTTTASGHLRFSFSQVPLSSDEDRELEENFLGHGVHVDIEDDDSMEPLSEIRTEKIPRQPIATSTEFESTSQCVEKLSIEECIEAVEKLGDIDGDTYNKLMDKLVPNIEWRKLLENDRHVCIKKAVAMCLYIFSHGAVVRVVSECFQRLVKTVFTRFKLVLKAFCHLANHIIKPKSQGETPSEIRNNPIFFPYFEKRISAIDGTHIAAWSPAQKQISYRDRKTQVTQNIMCEYSFDIMFTFVYTDWEGTVND